MYRYIGKRLLLMIPVLIGVAILIFTIMYFVPGDPATLILGNNATPQEVEDLRERMGLNDPYIVRLADYLQSVFLRFDLGRSYLSNRSVTDEIMTRFPRTVMIALISVTIAVTFGVPLGITAAVNQHTWKDGFCMFAALIGISMPGFWVGLMLVLEFSLRLGWLPAAGVGSIQHYILPCIANSLGGIAGLARMTRSSMLEVIRSDYITTARAKGQTKTKVIYVHALRNALIPVITSVGGMFAMMLGGALVIEVVFTVPGIGMYVVGAISSRDYPAIQGSVLFLAFTFGMMMLLVDILYAFIDPRIKSLYQSKKRRASS